MDNDEIAMKGYLQAVYDSTQGDPEIQASMHEVGIPLGYDKAESGRMAEELMVNGYVELRTLAGGISITTTGLDYLGFQTASPPSGSNIQLSGEVFATEGDKALIEKMCSAIKAAIAEQSIDPAAMEQAVFDLKALDLHLLSPQPKTAVILALCTSIDAALGAGSTIRQSTGLAAILE